MVNKILKMGVSSYHRGHRIHALQDSKGVYSDWRYSDGSKIKEQERACTRCGTPAIKEGHDHCIANLPNVAFACCGHGVEDGYVKLNNGKSIRFNTNYTREQIIEIINQNL